MATNSLQNIIFQVAEHRRMTAHSDRVGTVHEIQGSKMRVNIGNKGDGTPWLSPWLHTSNHRGGSKDHQQYAVGQTVKLSGAGGDYRQASVAPHAKSDAFPAPAQMPTQPAGDYVQTGGNSYETKTMQGSTNSWVSNENITQPPPQPASGQPETSGDSSSSGSSQQQQKPTPKMIHRIDPTGGQTMRYGNDDNSPRVGITKDGAKLRAGTGAYWVDKNGQPWVTAPPKIKKDSVIKNDNGYS
jgi:hypothetical protein